MCLLYFSERKHLPIALDMLDRLPVEGGDWVLFDDHRVHGVQVNRVTLVLDPNIYHVPPGWHGVIPRQFNDAFSLHRELVDYLGMIALDASYGIPDWRGSLHPLDGGALPRYLKLYLPRVPTGIKFRFNDHRIRLIHGVPRFQVPDRHVMASR